MQLAQDKKKIKQMLLHSMWFSNLELERPKYEKILFSFKRTKTKTKIIWINELMNKTEIKQWLV